MCAQRKDCADTAGKWPSAGQGDLRRSAPDDTWWPATPRSLRKWVSVVQANQSVAFCYGISSRLKHRLWEKNVQKMSHLFSRIITLIWLNHQNKKVLSNHTPGHISKKKKWKHYYKKIHAPQHSQQHYLNTAGYGSNLSIHWQRNG